MSKFIVLALSLLSIHTAQAMSPAPCAPTVRAQDTIIDCRVQETNVFIRIETFMTPPKCSDRTETHTAKIEFSNDAGQKIRELTIENGDFTYDLGEGGSGASLTSEKNNLKLEDCATPMYGGFSVGN